MQTQPLARAELAPVPRAISLLGATGSIGSITIDLLRQDPARYRVEAVTAYRNAAALAQLARELGARFAVVADVDAYGELKAELSGSGIEAGAGADAVVEAAERPADWVMAAITGATSLADAGRRQTRRDRCACQQGMPRLRRRAVHAAGAAAGAKVLPVDRSTTPSSGLGAGRREDVRRIMLTARADPFAPGRSKRCAR